ERELRMLEEYVLDEEVSDDVGESLMSRDEDFEPPEVPFQPKPTSVSILAVPEAVSDFAGDSNFTTMPKAERPEELAGPRPDDIHRANTMILENGRGRNAPRPPASPPDPRARTQPPPVPPPRSRITPARPDFDEDVHSAPTMIIDVGRVRGRGRR
ncbi:MAG TPA: hypothetical protein VFT22_29745, partial [Kofleriaceae bacterium]|nr:hypothetical protein [Kofleriaceae bacterium]